MNDTVAETHQPETSIENEKLQQIIEAIEKRAIREGNVVLYEIYENRKLIGSLGLIFVDELPSVTKPLTTKAKNGFTPPVLKGYVADGSGKISAYFEPEELSEHVADIRRKAGVEAVKFLDPVI